jgi:hypothetical protein
MAPPYHTDDAYLARLKGMLKALKNNADLHKTIVDAPFFDKKQTILLGLGMIVLTLVDKASNTVKRVAYSDTEPAKSAFRMSVKPFRHLVIPFDDEVNIIPRAIKTKKYQITDDWRFLFVPVLTPEEARFIQAGAGTDTSVVYPLSSSTAGGTIIFSFYEQAKNIRDEHHEFMNAYCAMVSTAIDEAAQSDK